MASGALYMKRESVVYPERRLAAFAAALLLAGCALHPLPEDVTGVSTYDIARQIRCETREAAKERVLTEIRTLAEGSPYVKGDPIAEPPGAV